MLFSVALCLPLSLSAQDYSDHRNVQQATHGTEFWVCFPRTTGGFSTNKPGLMVVAEHDCDVTVSNDRTGFSYTQHVLGHDAITRRYDTTNLIVFTTEQCCFMESYTQDEWENPSLRPASVCRNVQSRGFHVTSTDTIALYLLTYASGSAAWTNVLPVEMLRDEYVVQSLYTNEFDPGIDNYWRSRFAIVATEDNTVVDVVLSDYDWAGHQPGDTVTLTLNRGQLYHIANASISEIYPEDDPSLPTYHPITVTTHSYTPTSQLAPPHYIDLTGTQVKSRDHKPIALFDISSLYLFGDDELYNTCCGDDDVEQALPVHYAGRNFLIPKLMQSPKDLIRFTGLVNGTIITLFDAGNPSRPNRTFTLNAHKMEWFEMDEGAGPFVVTSSQPIFVRTYASSRDAGAEGDPAMISITPVEWWHSGDAHYYTLHMVDEEWNRYTLHYNLHLFTRTQDVGKILIDEHEVAHDFQPLPGTEFSYAYYDRNSGYNSIGKHTIRTTDTAFFYPIIDAVHHDIHGIFNPSHIQRGGFDIYINDRDFDSIPADTIYCLYDTIHFRARHPKPGDSVMWDFGDGTTLRQPFPAGLTAPHRYADTGRYTISCIVTYRPDSLDGPWGNNVFTQKPDTTTASVLIHNHYDSTFAVSLCEGTYTFRGHTFDYTDTFEVVTYWTPSGCDTLWTIDFTTCPHCVWLSDTIGAADLPWTFNGVTFNSARSGVRLYLDLPDDDCDSVIDYTLVVIPHWGEPPLDSIFLLIPNVFTPSQATNSRFKVVGNKFITQMEVHIFNRQGLLVAHFDGLADDWDGTHNGEPCPTGTYAYFIRYRDTEIDGWQTVNGTVTLIR